MPLSGGAGGHEYVDRGDPDAYDYTHVTLTADAAWHDLDLSAIVTDDDAVLVHLGVWVKDAAANKLIRFRKNGNAYAANVAGMYTEEPNTYMTGSTMVACDVNQVIEYYISAAISEIYVVVRGWFKPA